MKKPLEVYKRFIIVIRLLVIFVCFLYSANPLRAQQEVQLDTLVPAVIDSAAWVEEEATDESADQSVPVEQVERAVFLPKYQMSYGVIDSFKFYHLPPGKVNALKQDDAFWYADKNFNKYKPKPKEHKSNSSRIGDSAAYQFILWTLVIGGFIAFLVIYLLNSNVNIFRSTATIHYESDDEVLTDDIFSIAYTREIEKATVAGNFRLAIRLMFLRMLRNLSHKSMIDYKQDRTNFDYLMQLRSGNIYSDFFRLTRHYEYSWYGQFPVDADKFEMIRKEFESLDRKLENS